MSSQQAKNDCGVEKTQYEDKNFKRNFAYILAWVWSNVRASKCDPLCENPAKVIFCDCAFFSTKKHHSYGKEHSLKI